jgi:hypothetical protein
MLVSVGISAEQVRYYAKSALNGFDDLAPSDGIANARSEIRALLAYIDALSPTDDTVPVFGLSVVDGSRRLVRLGSQAQFNDPPDFKIAR